MLSSLENFKALISLTLITRIKKKKKDIKNYWAEVKILLDWFSIGVIPVFSPSAGKCGKKCGPE